MGLTLHENEQARLRPVTIGREYPLAPTSFDPDDRSSMAETIEQIDAELRELVAAETRDHARIDALLDQRIDAAALAELDESLETDDEEVTAA
jgi:hypothetical protein